MKLKKTYKILIDAFLLNAKASPKLFIIESIIALFSSVIGVAVIHTTRILLLTVEDVAETGRNLDVFYMVFIVFIVVALCKELIAWINDYISFVLNEKTLIALSEKMHFKARALNIIDYENPELLDLFNNASSGIYTIRYFSKNVLNFFIRDIPYLFFVGMYLYSLNPLLFLIPIFIFIPTVITQIIKAKSFVYLKEDQSKLDRKVSHYSDCIVERGFFKETRSLGAFSFFYNLLKETIDVKDILSWKTQTNAQLWELVSRFISLLGYYGVFVLLFFSLINGIISPASFAAVFSSIQMLYSTVEHIVCNRIGSILQNDFSDMKFFVDYMSLKERTYGKKEHIYSSNIVLNNVSFSYPSRIEKAVQDVNLNISRGSIIAIVGENGSGKTTLAKLILGLYKPDSGEIFVDGINANDISSNCLYKNKSAVFQDFYRYLFTLKENVTISDVEDETDNDRLNSATIAAGVNYLDNDLFPEQYETLLSKQFGGVDLSGGEWQRIALARGYFRKSQLIILDEPTASIDPIEENRVYQSFSSITKSKTTILITHRLGSTKMADIIIVMDKGKIVQTGSHEELMREEGLYKSLYASQAKWYE